MELNGETLLAKCIRYMARNSFEEFIALTKFQEVTREAEKLKTEARYRRRAKFLFMISSFLPIILSHTIYRCKSCRNAFIGQRQMCPDCGAPLEKVDPKPLELGVRARERARLEGSGTGTTGYS